MVERIRSAKLAPKARTCCSNTAYDDLVLVANSRPDRILVRVDFVQEVVDCHNRVKGEFPPANKVLPSLTQNGRKYFAVDRRELFAFVKAHGDICPDDGG